MNLLSGLVAAVALMAIGLPLHAAEDVTLRNGFDLVCNHREEVAGKVRLYTGTGEDNFLEVDAAEIVDVQTVPDPPQMTGDTLSKATVAPAPALTQENLRELMARAGARHNLDVDLLASVVRAESGGNARAVSQAGAQGLMQLMPQTAAQLGVADSFRPDQNINGGTAYLDSLLTRYHENLALALAAYNAGPAAVDKYHGVPPYRETRVYVARVIREFNRRKVAEMAKPPAVASVKGAVQSAN
jgi:Transglycosylase SLT domain